MTSIWKSAGSTGNRIDTTARYHKAYQVNRPGRRVEGQSRGKRESVSQKRGYHRTIQAIVSAVILIVVVGVKLLMPDVMAQYRDKLLSLVGCDTDFVETFSAVGRVLGDGTIGEAIGEAYQEVFGSSQMEEAEETAQKMDNQLKDFGEREAKVEESQSEAEQIVYNAKNLPKNVCLTQQILDFSYATPLQGTLSSPFGYREHPLKGGEKFHYGLDIAADEGTAISAFAAGTVTAVGESSELGKYVMIAHENGYTTLYAHCSRITASSEQMVRCGDPIAEVGQSGDATGPHLHFELHKNTTYLNPIYYVSL